MDNITEKFLLHYPVKDWEEFGLFSKEDIGIINQHWMKYPPPKAGHHLILAMIYGMITVVGVGSNLLVLMLLLKRKKLLTPPNILVLNLALSDMLMTGKSPVIVINSLYNGPVFGELGCKIYGFIGGLTGTASIMSLAVMSCNRYRVVSKPLDPERKSTKIKSFLQILFIWVYSATFSSLPLFGISRYVPEGYLTSCSFEYLSDNLVDKIFIFTFFIGAWLVPFSTISYCYIGIVRSVRVNEFNLPQGISDSEYHKKIERKITKTVFTLIALWIMSWTPYAFVALLGISGNKDYVTPVSSMIPGVICKISACINPFLYALSHPIIKKEIFRMMHKICLSNNNENVLHLDFIEKRSIQLPSSSSESFNKDVAVGPKTLAL